MAFGLADDFLDGAGHGGLDLAGRRVRLGDDQARAADRDGGPGLLLQLAGGPAVQQLARPGADHRADRGRGQQQRSEWRAGGPASVLLLTP